MGKGPEHNYYKRGRHNLWPDGLSASKKIAKGVRKQKQDSEPLAIIVEKNIPGREYWFTLSHVVSVNRWKEKGWHGKLCDSSIWRRRKAELRKLLKKKFKNPVYIEGRVKITVRVPERYDFDNPVKWIADSGQEIFYENDKVIYKGDIEKWPKKVFKVGFEALPDSLNFA